MSNLQEIETKIKQLPNHEIHQLDQIIAKAEADILENNTKELDEIFIVL